MNAQSIARLASPKNVAQFQEYPQSLPCGQELIRGAESTPCQTLAKGKIGIGNRIAVQPLEGWDSTPSDGYRKDSESGARLAVIRQSDFCL